MNKELKTLMDLMDKIPQDKLAEIVRSTDGTELVQGAIRKMVSTGLEVSALAVLLLDLGMPAKQSAVAELKEVSGKLADLLAGLGSIEIRTAVQNEPESKGFAPGSPELN